MFCSGKLQRSTDAAQCTLLRRCRAPPPVPWPQYAERVFIALLEKQVPFHLVHVDLARKPAWYRGVNPRGLVPAVQHEGEVRLGWAAGWKCCIH